MLNFFTPSLEERKRKSYLAFKQDEQQMNKSFFFYIKQITSQSHINMKSKVPHTRKKRNKQGKNNHV